MLISWSLVFVFTIHGKFSCLNEKVLAVKQGAKVMFLFPTGVWGEIKLQQPQSSEVKRPGDTVKISCVTSGYTMTDYSMNWIRQKSGKGLEWIGWINTNTAVATYASSFQSRFTFTQDVSSNTQFLQITGLTTEDSAVYFCAREHSD